ncbi:MAG: VOC family protein [Pseudomonadota bacterium]|nr:VOC family protein [Pseudomonadota bacterium]
MKFAAYLFFDGNCEEAFRYYSKLFGGKISAMLPHEGTPAEPHVPAEWRKKIMHACLEVGDAMLMASDSPPEHREKSGGFSVSIQIDDPKEAERVFAGLADGGETTMPMGETFWAQRFGMCRDRFGKPWMVNCPLPA